MKFDILQLHNPGIDKKPFSWICFDINRESRLILKELIEVRIKKSPGKMKFVESLAKELNCSYDLIERYINFRKKWFAIPILLELLKQCNPKDRKIFRIKINQSIISLKVANPTGKQVHALKHLTIELCEVAGALAADGTILLRVNSYFKDKPSTLVIRGLESQFSKIINVGYDKSIKRYVLSLCLKEEQVSKFDSIVKQDRNFERLKLSYFSRITEETVKPLEIVTKNLQKDFRVSYSPLKIPQVNGWCLSITNKVIIRYFLQMLNLDYGNKTHSVSLSKCIQKQSVVYRDAFIRGFMQFDGSVELRNTVTVQLVSRNMILNIANHLKLKKIKFNLSNKQDKKGLWTIKIWKNQDLEFMFLPGTLKHQLLTNSFSYRPKSKEEGIVQLNLLSKRNMILGLGDFLAILESPKTIQGCSKVTNISITALHSYLSFLLRANVVRRRKEGKAFMYWLNHFTQWKLPNIP